MKFKEEKAAYLKELGKPDRSKKGGVDWQIIPLLDVINAKKEYYTTSSCAGRIVLFAEPSDGRKDHAEWLFSSHDLVRFEEIKPALAKIKDHEEIIFLRQESAILHVCCDSLESAEDLITIAKECGFKRTGIMGIKKRIMLEVMSTEKLDAPVADKGVLLVSDDYLRKLIEIADFRLARCREKMKRFEKRLHDLN